MNLAQRAIRRVPSLLDQLGVIRLPDMVCVTFTLGFGNNLFQYIAARLLAEQYELPLWITQPPSASAISEFSKLGIDLNVTDSRQFRFIITERYYEEVARGDYPRRRMLLSGFFEDYRYFLPHLETIRSWFQPVEKRSGRDLALHFRTGDRLFMKEEFYEKPRIADYLAAIERFDFDRLRIVSDLPVWKAYTEAELRSVNFHRSIPEHQAVPLSESIEYLNEFVEGLSRFDPTFRSTSPAEDFDYLRTFDNVLFEHGTLSWWAAVLGGASHVGVYGPWRPWRGESNRNLSEVPLDGWFRWDRLTD